MHTYIHTHTQIKVWQKHAARVIANALLADLEVAQLPTEVSPLRFLNLNITLGDIITYDLNIIIVQRREQMITRYIHRCGYNSVNITHGYSTSERGGVYSLCAWS